MEEYSKVSSGKQVFSDEHVTVDKVSSGGVVVAPSVDVEKISSGGVVVCESGTVGKLQSSGVLVCKNKDALDFTPMTDVTIYSSLDQYITELKKQRDDKNLPNHKFFRANANEEIEFVKDLKSEVGF